MDFQGGQLTQTNGNPPFPGSAFTGPLVAGNVLAGDGSGNLAGVGETTGLSNVGYAVMAQSMVITQATNGGSAGVFTANQIVIPAQSQVLRITLMVTTAWTGAASTLGIGVVGTATFFTAAGALTASALGPLSATPGTSGTIIGHWDNVGTSDVEVLITSTNTGNGVGTLTVEYLQSVNLAS